MEQFYDKVIKHRKKILLVFLLLFFLSLGAKELVAVNYDLNDYLPEDSPSTVAIDVMEKEFDGAIPNARVMIKDVTIPEALEYKEKMEQVDGVLSVNWLDDAVNINQPLESQDSKTIETYYKDNTALFTVTIEEEKTIATVDALREIIGEDNAMTGSAVNTAAATTSTVKEIGKIAIIAVLFALFVLLLTTNSYVEPFIVLIGLGVAIVINAGTNLIFGEISFVTNAAGSILQLAVSMDYSVFLMHRFTECRKDAEPITAMKQALCKSTSSILSSGVTTVIGFLALALMRFKIGPDLGLALAKGIAISLITVFLFMPGFILLTYKWMDKTEHKPFLPAFRKLGAVIVKVTLPLMCIFVLMIVPSYLASTHNDYYFGASHIFGKNTKVGQDTKKIEDVFGKGDTYILLVPKGDTATETKLSQELKQLDEVTSVVSYVDMAGAEIPYEYLDESTLCLLESEHYSRMVLSIDADFEGEETFDLVREIRSIAKKYYEKEYYLAGEGVSTYDLMDSITADMVKVNFIAVLAVFLVLIATMRSLSLPVTLVLTIESAIWINLSIPYYTSETLFYIAYLIISSIQLGATVDYAILFTERYKENRKTMGRKECVIETISNVTVSILTSGTVLTVVGFLLGKISTHGLLSQLGYLLGKGTLCSLIAVLFILPGFIEVFDFVGSGKKKEKAKA